MHISIRILIMFILIAPASVSVAQVKVVQRSPGLVEPASQLEPVLNPFSAPLATKSSLFSTLPITTNELVVPPSSAIKVMARDDRGLPVWAEIALSRLLDQSPEEQARTILERMAPSMKIMKPDEEWQLYRSELDGSATGYLVFHQVFQSIPIDMSECRIHFRNGHAHLFAGRYQPTPMAIGTETTVSEYQARQIAESAIQARPVTLSAAYLPVLDEPKLVILDESFANVVAWRFSLMADAMHRWTVYIDARSGAVVHKRQETCSLTHDHVDAAPVLDGPFTANATDLKGVSRLINTYQVGSTFFMLDGSRPMFKPASSKLPDDPVGGILTIDAKNTSPASGSFKPAHVTSTNNTWNHPAAVSAHYNAGIAFTYYQQTFNRNSINGTGGSILSFVNVADDDGGSMDNAYWNGAAMFYGNGDQAFLPLARSLDVAGHEMTHGVIQATANLVYEKEPGALNESFADIFAAMIDRDDWRIGEEVVKPSVFPSGALRDLKDPHNGGSGLGSPGWQPKHTNEQYTGSQDNGGVHINSGIPNHAFYLFASNAGVTLEQAEQVFYHALDKYLVKSSKFLDLRYAVVQACKDKFGAGTPLVGIAENAFNAVGIGSGNTGGGTPDDYQDDINPNPGDDFVLFTNDAQPQIYVSLPDGSGVSVLSPTQPLSRPSVTDDGEWIVFIGKDKKMHLIVIDWTTGTPSETIIQNQPIWVNVAIAKDGSRIAAIPDAVSPLIQVFDFGLNEWSDFGLYNPTFSEGVQTSEVQYADALEFDHSGNFVAYDAYNLITYDNGTEYDYWDIGFLQVWNPETSFFSSGNIFKLFSSIPDLSAVANPTFAKNSEYVLAFDFYDGQSNSFSILGTNLETGEVGLIYENTVLGYPNYSVFDDQLIFDAEAGFFLDPVLARIDLHADKISGDEATAVALIDGGARGAWFANGDRPLTDLKPIPQSLHLVLEPNPGTTGFTLRGIAEQSIVTVYTSLGYPVKKVTNWVPGTFLDLDHLPPGVYWVEVMQGREIGRTAWTKIH